MTPSIESAPADNKPLVDANVLSKFAPGTKVVSATRHGVSHWTSTERLVTASPDGTESVTFLKTATGDRGRGMMQGEFESMTAIHSVTPGFAPRPIAWGSYASTADNTHFFLCAFHDMDEVLPNPARLGAQLAALHRNSKSPSGRYGFHVTTYNGILPQDNGWSDSWEEFFARGLRHLLRLEEEAQGPDEEMQKLWVPLLEKVVPRLLRPLERAGAGIKPSLVHGDLWCGNAAVDRATQEPIVFDACTFWAHNEYELGNWRHKRNKFTQRHFDEYHKIVEKTHPKEDYDDRNALYGLRFNMHASILFPSISKFHGMVVDEMRRLVEKYPDGLDGYTP